MTLRSRISSRLGPLRPRRAGSGVHYDTDWARSNPAKWVREFSVYGFQKPAVALYARPTVYGRDRIDGISTPVIFAANHHSHADTSIMLAVLPRALRRDLAVVAAADYFFPNALTSAASALFIGAIPMERHRISKLSIENALAVIASGHNVLIYPEGGRSPDGWSQPHRPGAAFVAKRADVPVVPVYLQGSDKVLPRGRNWPVRADTSVSFGSPIDIAPNENARAFAQRIEHAIAALAEEREQGWWEATKRAHAGQTTSLHGPEAGMWRRQWLRQESTPDNSERPSTH